MFSLGDGGGPVKSIPYAFFAKLRNLIAHGWFEVANSLNVFAGLFVSILTISRSGAPLPGGLR